MNKKRFLGFSLDYELKFRDTFRDSTHILTGIQADTNKKIYQGGVYSHGLYMSWENCTPICRPLSDLYNQITHKGETFIPIVELAKLAYSKLSWKCEAIGDKCYLCLDNGKLAYRFFYSQNEQAFSTISIVSNETKYVPYQLQLFEKLVEWHFNLMDESEPFIDVNTLPENPYK